MQWYYVKDGQRQGPVDEEVLRGLARSGSLKADDLVWNETMGDQWRVAAAVPGLFLPPPLPVPANWVGAPGQTPNRELMARARISLQGQWGAAVAATIIYFAVS